MRAWIAGAGVALLLASACSGSSHDPAPARASRSSASTTGAGSATTGTTPSAGSSNAPNNPLADAQFWVVPDSPAAREVQRRLAAGHQQQASLLRKIASRPTAIWLGSWQSLDQLRNILNDAGQASATAVLVAYFIPNRDCGGLSAGGARNNSDYRNWIRTLAGKLGNHSAVVILEPDAVPMASPGGCAAGSLDQRAALLRDAISVLKAHQQVHVYLDAGHPAWPSDPTVSVGPLLTSGLAQADGFALNTSNFQRTSDDLSYGDALSALVGGKHFVVDTGRNGSGPLPDDSGYRGPSWCNPPGRALGTPPTADTGDPLADAFLWVKYPGESDGSCGLGDQPAGSWLADYAIGLASRATG